MHEIINQFKDKEPDFARQITEDLKLNKDALIQDIAWNDLEKFIKGSPELSKLRPILSKVEQTIFEFILCLAKFESMVRQGINDNNSQEFDSLIERQSDLHQTIIDNLAELATGLDEHSLTIPWLENVFGKSLSDVASEYNNSFAQNGHYLSADRAKFRQLALTTAFQILSQSEISQSVKAA